MSGRTPSNERLLRRAETAVDAIEHDVHINAPRALVYRVLTDFASYAAWNPWVTHAAGSAAVDAAVHVVARLGKRSFAVEHRVTVATPDERFAWCDMGWFTPLARGQRLRTLFDDDGGTRLHVRLVVLGPLARLAWALHGANMRAGLLAESRALATRAELLASGKS